MVLPQTTMYLCRLAVPNLGTLLSPSNFDSVRVEDFRTMGGWRKFDLVRVLDFRAWKGWEEFWPNEGAGFSTQVRRLSWATRRRRTDLERKRKRKNSSFYVAFFIVRGTGFFLLKCSFSCLYAR